LIYLLRHGQTAFNREGRLQGHVDSPLTELGEAQARAAGATLRGLIGDLSGWSLVSSPLGRARRTAELVGEALGRMAPVAEPRLIELSFGDWDGGLRADLEARHPEAFGETGWAFRAPLGESFEAASGRMADWLASLPPEGERRVIAVTHGVAGRVLRGVYAGLTRAETVVQPVPQDAVYRLSGGQIQRFECALPED
jgi:broad specificity phosphatase PhoE